MSFLYPSLLFGLALVSVPILIHFLNFYRIKKVEISTIRFLEETKEQRNKWLKLKEWLVLLCRVFAIVFLVLAFAQPFFPDASTHDSRNEILFLDNRMSSGIADDEYTLLDQQVNLARSQVSKAGPGTLFKVITHDFDQDPAYWLNASEALEYINQVQVSQKVEAWDDVLKRAKTSLSLHDKEVSFTLLSDFNKAYFEDYWNESIDSQFVFKFIPVQLKDLQNIAVDSVWIDGPIIKAGQTCQLYIALKYYGEQGNKSSNLSLHLNENVVSSSRVELSAENPKQTLKFDFTVPDKGWNYGQITLDDLPVHFDNEFYFSFYAVERVKTIVVSGTDEKSAFQDIYKPEPIFEVHSFALNAIDFKVFDDADLVILNQLPAFPEYLSEALRKHIESGGTIFFLPKGEKTDPINLEGLNVVGSVDVDESLTDLKVKNIEEDVFRDVFAGNYKSGTMPKSTRYLSLKGGKTVLGYANGLPYLKRYSQEEGGELYVVADSWESGTTNILQNALVVPLMYNAGFASVKTKQALYQTFNDDWCQIKLRGHPMAANFQFSLLGTDSSEAFVPEQYTHTNILSLALNELGATGVYSLKNGAALVSFVSINLTKKSSDVLSFNLADLEEISNRSAAISLEEPDEEQKFAESLIVQDNSKLWKYCLILVLIFLLGEMLIIKYF